MSAYLVGQIQVKDSLLWQEYVAGVSESLLPFDGAKVIFRGTRTAVLAGENERSLLVLIKFPDNITLTEWFKSDKYQSLIPLRDKAADVVITTYEPY